MKKQLLITTQKSVCSAMLFVLFSFVYPTITQAQKGFSYGLKAGLNLSTSSYNRFFTDKKVLKPGFQVGITGEFGFTDAFFLQSELVFTTKGAEYRGAESWIGGTNPPITHWRNIFTQNYVQVPLKVAYKFNAGADLKLFVNAGGYAAYGISGTDKTKNRYTKVDRPDDESVAYPFKEGALKRFDTGALLGFGAEYKRFTLGINYEHGLADIGAQLSNSVYDFEYHNRNIAFTLGYRIR